MLDLTHAFHARQRKAPHYASYEVNAKSMFSGLRTVNYDQVVER
jgi:hypothetical protein